MKIKELIEKLMEFDLNMDVEVFAGGDNYNITEAETLTKNDNTLIELVCDLKVKTRTIKSHIN